MSMWQAWGSTLLGVLACAAVYTDHSVEGSVFLTGAVIIAALRR